MYGTARKAYIDILTELVKEEAPTLYLEDFLYYFNKSINEFIKKRYELFEVTQQVHDDLRFWKKPYNTDKLEIGLDDIDSQSYRHVVGCTVDVTLTRPDSRCEQDVNTTKAYKAVRMTSDIKTGILNNSYLEPKFYRPYFDIVNNRFEIKVGDIDTKSVKIGNILIEYLSDPEEVDLTEAQINAEADSSQILEFSTTVGDEINKICLGLILERGSSHRLQANQHVNQSINDLSIRGQQ